MWLQLCSFLDWFCRCFWQEANSQARKRHINTFLSGWSWDDPRFVPGISPGLSLGQTRWKPGTKPGFLLILHSGSPANPGLSLGQTQFVPGTIPGTKGGTESLCEKSLCAFFGCEIPWENFFFPRDSKAAAFIRNCERSFQISWLCSNLTTKRRPKSPLS